MPERNYNEYMASKLREYGETFDSSDLALQFIPYFESGQRIEVTSYYAGGTTVVRRGTVGVTTGWKPTFLLMHRSSDVGSSDLLQHGDKVTAIIDKRGKRHESALRDWVVAK